MGESGNVALIETPSKVMSPPINKTLNIDEIDNVGIISHDKLGDDDMCETYEPTHLTPPSITTWRTTKPSPSFNHTIRRWPRSWRKFVN